jgi:uncharacterized protein with FMN-binding domain
MKRKQVIILAVLVVIIGAFLAITGIKSYLEANLNKLSYSTISNIDLSKIKDGIYSGSYKAFPINVQVKVTVSNQKITGIELVKHDNGQGAAAETITDKVIEAQTLEVDVVSGATYSSKVILKAIENALNSAK